MRILIQTVTKMEMAPQMRMTTRHTATMETTLMVMPMEMAFQTRMIPPHTATMAMIPTETTMAME